MEIKAEKQKPGMKEAIQLHLRQKAERDERVRRKLKKKLLAVYEKEIGVTLNIGDQQFSKIVLQIDRLHKILAA